MITDKITHQFNFNPIKSTVNDPYAQSVVLNTNLINQRSTTEDPYAPYVVFNMRLDQPENSYFFSDDCGNILTRYGSSVAKTIDGRMGLYLRGYNSGDYLQFSDTQDVHFDLGDFTIECWIYLTSLSQSNQYPCVISQRTNYNTENSFTLYFDGNR